MVINTIRSHKQKFGREYGEVVIACDNRKYWRKQQFQYYKANRKKVREESGFDWPLIFDTINILKEEIKTFFPYRVLEVDGAEADDIIATLAEWSQTNDLVQDGLFEKKQPMLIISGDHDFIQLQKYDNVRQYSPIQKKYVKADISPEKYVIEHIIRGDKGDGIPNVLSADDSIINGVRQSKISSKKLEEWLKDPSTMPKDETFKRNYDRNKLLVDFSSIPHEIKTSIINTFESAPKGDKSKLLDYFITNRMKMMMEHLEEF
jgi:5'-3' exonuclease